MARVTGQIIPSEVYGGYTRTLAPASSTGRVGRRYPFALPHMRTGQPRVSQAAQVQRDRFKAAAAKFAAMPEAQRERYYAAAPEWNSVLWYYNYAMMSALAGNANADAGGCGVIKTIQNVSGLVTASGVTSLPIAAIDHTKAVVMLYGASYISDKVQRGTSQTSGSNITVINIDEVDPALCSVQLYGSDLSISVPESGDGGGSNYFPLVVGLTNTTLSVRRFPLLTMGSMNFGFEITEHRAQTVYPIVDAIESEAVKLKWSLEPSQGATVSALVIEYI